MPKIIFIYRGNKYEKVYKDENLKLSIFDEYLQKINRKMNEILFLFKGKYISFKNNLFLMKILNPHNNIIITVYNLKRNITNDNISDNIICPDCKNLTFLNFNDININNCKNIHMNEKSKEFTSITEFMDNQIIDEEEIKCDICNNNKYLIIIFIFVLVKKKYVNYALISMKKVMSIT